jgi:hypothetical protein
MNNTYISKAAIFFAALLCCLKINAQTYNNWLLNDGYVLHFAPNNVEIKHTDIDNHYHATIAISDDNGDFLIYGRKIFNPNAATSDFIIKNIKGNTLASFETLHIMCTNYCKSSDKDKSYYASVVYDTKKHFHKYCLKIYRFDNNGTLKDSIICKELGYSGFLTSIPKNDGSVILLAYNINKQKIELFKLFEGKIKEKKEYDIQMKGFHILQTLNRSHSIRKSLNSSKIIADSDKELYIIDYNSNTDNISLNKKIESNNMFHVKAFSEHDKYLFCVYNNNTVIRYKLTPAVDFFSDNYETVYKFKGNIIDMQLGIDNKIYVMTNRYINQSPIDQLFTLDKVETDDLVVQEIEFSGTASYNVFPEYPRSSTDIFCEKKNCDLSVLLSTNIFRAKSFLWDFGDGTEKSSDTSPIHTYKKSGVYTVKLKAKFSSGETKTFEKEITVNNPPEKTKIICE